MPGNIFTRRWGCFGDTNQVQENHRPPARPFAAPRPQAAQPVAPAYTPMMATFLPARNYLAAELIHLASTNPPRAETKAEFLDAMAAAFDRSSTSRLEKADLCRHISKLMRDDEVVFFKGAPRQANYFASYCIDLNFQELDVAYNYKMEQDVREMLSLWAHTLCPAQAEFNMDGVIYTRDEVTTLLRSQSIIIRKSQPENTLLTTQMEQSLRNTRGAQNVHDQSVRNNGVRVMAIMREKHGQITEMTDREINNFLNPFIQQEPRKANVRAGLNHCLSVDGFDSNAPGAMTPRQLLGNVCHYIQATNDAAMRGNLTAALMTRLNEIQVESPCVTGVSQRLLDVPNGIDPDMNFSGRTAQVGQDVATLAGKTYTRFTDLVEEGLQAIQEIENREEITGNEQTISDLGQNMFTTRLNNDLHRLGGISESEIAPHRERLKTGFTN